MATGTRAIVLRKDGTSRLLATAEMPASVDEQYDLSDVSPTTAIRDALDTLLFGGNRIIRVFGLIGGDAGTGIEVVLKDTRLRNAMLAYSGRRLFRLDPDFAVHRDPDLLRDQPHDDPPDPPADRQHAGLFRAIRKTPAGFWCRTKGATSLPWPAVISPPCSRNCRRR